MSSYWGGRSYVDQQDGYGGGLQYEVSTGGSKHGTSRLKKSSGAIKKDDDDDYAKYAGGTEGEADYDSRYNRPSGNYSDSGGGNGHYNGGTALGAPYYGGGKGYGSSSPYGGGGGYSTGGGGYYGTGGGGYGTGADGGGYAPSNNAPAPFWALQDGTRSPMFISAREVHLHGVPAGYDNDNSSSEQGRERGFFGPALHAVGHFFDRRFGFSDRN
ncbi:hypothetical protein BS78_03G379800 [Paspalum vaginatum]|nr:hypothetical protein BS78_03G379800 [Paspalum vaginatum]